ncbi:MAG TPA: ATP-binding protein [Acetobacteraceae bacterium]|nr:ATP-binding protein [Acetobacteraceae bacterium]
MAASIRGRLIALHLLAVALAAAILTSALHWRVALTADRLQQEALHAQALHIASFVHATDRGVTLDLPGQLQEHYGTDYGRYVLLVTDATGRTVFASRSQETPLAPVDADASDPRYFTTNLGTQRFYGVSVPVRVAGYRAIVQLAEDQSHRDSLLDDVVADFVPQAAWVIVGILLLLLLADLMIFDRALRPLMRASALAGEIGPERADLRLPEATMPREVRPLVRAVNAGLDRLADSLALERSFVADAAHELRTPLAILRAQAEALPDRAASRQLVADIDAMARIVQQMLDLADSDALTLQPGERADLAGVASEVAAFLAPMALAAGKEVELRGADAPLCVAGNATALFRAIRNLVENAIRHAPRSSTVQIEVRAGGSVVVRDRGPGVPEDQHEAIFQRFWRGDRRRTGGAGLGLAIVARIARTHGGSVRVGSPPGGGAEFVLQLCPCG